MSIIENIRKLQAGLVVSGDEVPPAHNPEMLLIGCIDARLNISSIGILYGSALIYRNIAALIAGTRSEDDPEHVGEAATLEFAVNVMKVRDIVVMGHTDCGGIRACLHGAAGMRHIVQYLSPLEAVRQQISNAGVTDETQLINAMEEAAVRQSVANLRTYGAVTDALAKGTLALHGWVVNTGNKRISEMDITTGEFRLMR